MASCQTTRWVSTSPYAKLTVTQTSSTDTSVTLSWTLQYISDTAASTNGVGRSYTVKIGSTTVASGTYNIHGVTGTKTVASGTHTVSKTTSAQTVSFSLSFAFNVTWSGTYGGTKSASGSISVAAKTSYTVSYNANGGSGAPSAQTKWYGTALTLSSTKPTRTGYAFQGWATSSSGSVVYAAGASYTANAAVTLYAVWKANTYTVSYNANGGSGAPSSQTKTYGVTLTLSSTKPTRTNYTFKGWGTSASATTVAYAAGASYTANAAATLYAIWELSYTKPRITNLSVFRCDSDGSETDEGIHARVQFDWKCDLAGIEGTVAWKTESDDGEVSWEFSSTESSGSVDSVLDSYTFTTESTYTFTITVTDASGYSTAFATLAGTRFIIDFRAGGTGAAFGKPAELDDVLDIAFQTRHMGGLLPMTLEVETDLNTIVTPNTYIGADLSKYNYTCGGNALPLSSGTFTLEVVAMGDAGQVKQRLVYCHKTASRAWERLYYGSAWGDWICVSDFDGQLLWSGVYYMTSSQTATLAEPISKQRSGIVLVFSRYSDSTARDYHFNVFFVPKYQIAAHAGCGHTFMMSTDASFGLFAAKYLYINDATIVGNDINSTTGTGSCGITYTNSAFVLRHVIGV